MDGQTLVTMRVGDGPGEQPVSHRPDGKRRVVAWLRRREPVVATIVFVLAVLSAVAGVATERVLFTTVGVVPGYGAVGMLLARRRAAPPVARALLAIASTATLSFAGVAPELVNGLLAFGLSSLLVRFPDGRTPSRVWWIPMGVLAASMALGGWMGTVSLTGHFALPVATVTAAAALVWCTAAPVIRFRHGTPLTRAQLRWLAAAASLGAVGIATTGAGLATGNQVVFGLGGLAVGLVLPFGIPVAVLIAITRYRLYEINRLISRTVTYAIVAALIGAIYAGALVTASELLGDANPAVVAGSTLLAALLTAPVRRRVRRIVDRRFNRVAHDAASAAEAFLLGVGREPDPGSATAGLVDLVLGVYQPVSVGLWLREPPGPTASPRQPG